MKDDKNLLVTGGSGLIGSTIPAQFKPSRDELNLMNIDDIVLYLHSNQIDSIIHCAGKVGGVKANQTKLGEFFYENIIMNTNLLEAARICGVDKVVSFMSTCVFPSKTKYPLVEEYIHKGEPHETNYGYAYAKRMLDVHSRAYRDQYGCNFVTIIPCNVYGCNDYYNLDDSHVIPALIHKCYLAKRDNTDFLVWGDGKAKREFMYADDAGKIALNCLENYNDPHPLIVAPDKEYTIKQVVNYIVEIMEFDGNVVYQESEVKGQHRKPSDTTKMSENHINYKFTSLRKGLEQSIKWFVAYYESEARL